MDANLIAFANVFLQPIGQYSLASKAAKLISTISTNIARTYHVDEFIWDVAKEAWRPPFPATDDEMDNFVEHYDAILSLNAEAKHTLLESLHFVCCQHSSLILRIWIGMGKKAGPWIATLIYAVHQGAGQLIERWASIQLMNKLLDGFGQEGLASLTDVQKLLYVKQVNNASKAFVDELKGLATNQYWSKISRSESLPFERLEKLPTIESRESLGMGWNALFLSGFINDVPMYKTTRTRAEISWQGSRLQYPYPNVVSSAKEYFDQLERVFVHDSKEQIKNSNDSSYWITLIYNANPEFFASMNGVSESSHSTKAKVLIETYTGQRSRRIFFSQTLSSLRLLINPSSRIILLEPKINLQQVIKYGENRRENAHLEQGKLLSDLCDRYKGFIHNILCGTTIDEGHTNDDFIARQTATGLLIRDASIYDQRSTSTLESNLPVLWNLRDIRLKDIAPGTNFVYHPSEEQFRDELPGYEAVGFLKNVLLKEIISGIIQGHNNSLIATCQVNKQVFSTNYTKILAKLYKIQPPKGCMHPISIEQEELSRSLPQPKLEFAYIDWKLVLRALVQKRVTECVGDKKKPLLFTLGNSISWQILSLGAMQDTPLVQGETCEECLIGQGVSSSSGLVIAGANKSGSNEDASTMRRYSSF